MNKTADIVRVAFYIRVSTPEQTKGFWPEFQLNALNDLIKYKENQSPKWITNKKWLYEDWWFSWSDLQRPAYKQMIEDAKNGEFDMIAVWKIDRMSRNLSHLLKTFEDLKQYGVWFYSVKENIDFSWPIWKLTFQIFWALAEFEREMIKSRTIEWKIASARMWNYIQGSAPYWYIKKKNETWKWSKLEIVIKEKEIVKKVFEWFIYEDLSYTDIMKKLNKMKVPKWEWWVRKNIEYTKWYETTVKDILIESAYMWYVEEKFKKDWEEYDVIVPTPKIISKQLFELAQAKVKEIEEERKWWKRKYLLSWKVYDAIEFTERWDMRKFVWVIRTKWWHSYRRDSFVRKDWEKVKNKEFPWKPLDEFVWNHILNFVNKPDKFFKLYKKQTTELNNIDRYREEIEILQRRNDEEEVAKVNIEKKEINWRLSEEKADKYIAECNKNIKENNKKISQLDEKIEKLLNLELSKDIIEKISKDFVWKIENLSDEQKRRIADILVDRVLVWEDSDKNMLVEVIFRFNVDIEDKWDRDLELKDSSNKTKNTSKGVLTCQNGAPGRIRTHGKPRFAAWCSSNWATGAWMVVVLY